MKDLLENIVLMLLTALLFMGVYNYCKSNEEPKDEDPIVDVLPGDNEEQEPSEDEVQLKEVQLNFTSGTTGPTTSFPMLTYYDGCTWGELLEFNDFLRLSDDGSKILWSYDNGTSAYDFILTDYNSQKITPDIVFEPDANYSLLYSN